MSGAVLVQTTGRKSLTNAAGAGAVYTFGVNITAGNTVILAIASFKTIGSVTMGGTVATEVIGLQSVASSNYRVGIWMAQNVTGGTPNVVIDQTNTGSYCIFSAEEWSGVSASATDSTQTNQATSTTAAVTSATLAQAKELIYAIAINTTAGTSVLSGPTSGFTQLVLNNDAVDLTVASGYVKVGATTAITANFASVVSTEMSSVIATFKTI